MWKIYCQIIAVYHILAAVLFKNRVTSHSRRVLFPQYMGALRQSKVCKITMPTIQLSPHCNTPLRHEKCCQTSRYHQCMFDTDIKWHIILFDEIIPNFWNSHKPTMTIRPCSGAWFAILSVLLSEVLAQCWRKFLTPWQNVAECSRVCALVQFGTNGATITSLH